MLSDTWTFAKRFARRSWNCARILSTLVLILSFSNSKTAAQNSTKGEFFIDCSGAAGDGSSSHPWNTIAAAQAHPFSPGDRIALRRGTTCHGSFAPSGSGASNAIIRLTAYGEGPRPRIVAGSSDRQVLLLSNQEYWQVDSLDLSGANTYGIYITGDKGLLHHIYLRNLAVHDVFGGEMKHKDNGLVVIGPGKLGAYFEDVLIDGVDAAHTNQWVGILVGGGPFYIPPEKFINQHIMIRNSTAHDVFGDGIVLFRDAQSSITTSAAWETGMQPTQTIGTPDAIWTWTCTDCRVADNEAFLTDSPGVDGGAYDIDWGNTRNTVERNFAHDTQGYCFSVFAAGYVTAAAIVRDNLCIDNGLSPRLAVLQGAVFVSTWNGGVIHDARIENNTVIWNPPVSSAAAVVEAADSGGTPIVFTGNRIESSAPLLYRAGTHFTPSSNTYGYSKPAQPRFTLGKMGHVPLETLQSAGFDRGSTLSKEDERPSATTSLHLEATQSLQLDSDGLLAPEPHAQLVVLRSLANQYPPDLLKVTVHLRETKAPADAQANALRDLDAEPIQFDHGGQGEDDIRLLSANGHVLKEWKGFQNASALGGAVRKLLGAPRYSQMNANLPPKGAR